eukprot:GFUD01012742.1.p1 GENE.GFUD01012742.1~~GFUD01012742.1.p1  ORF type:complete len:409 (+),score=129.27 GFUD01012742.1:35-1261(+)
MLPCPPSFLPVFYVWLVLPSLVLIDTTAAADTLKGLLQCMNHEDCLGANRVCSHQDQKLTGMCVCREGYVRSGESFACVRKEVNNARSIHVTCETDEDCNRNEVCMSWQYDPTLEYARKLRTKLSTGANKPEKHQFCIDAWIIYNNHLEDLDEPRTGGGLRSNRRNFDAEEYLFGGRRPPRVHQQYIGFAEDMMLILFLVCILATLVTVHRAACYRQIQDARRNTPLRHILPIAEDRPPPYTGRSPDSADGLSAVVCESSAPKTLSEAPPPSYEEALYRQTVRIPEPEEIEDLTEQEGMMDGDLGREVQESTDNVDGVNCEPTVEILIIQSIEDVQGAHAATSCEIDVGDSENNNKSEDNIDNIEFFNEKLKNHEMEESEKPTKNDEECNVSKSESCEPDETGHVVNV